MTSACGVCGRSGIDDLIAAFRYDLTADRVTVTPEVLAGLPGALSAAQQVFSRTGGLHAAGLFTPDGTLLAAREDVGRHNAVDKVVGWALRDGRLPLSGYVLLVSGRASFELAQKAVMAGIPVLAAVSAPSSLAAELAADSRADPGRLPARRLDERLHRRAPGGRGGGIAATTRARDYVPFPVSTSPQRRRISPLTWLNPMSTTMPMVRITMMIEIAPAMSSWSWLVVSSTPSENAPTTDDQLARHQAAPGERPALLHAGDERRQRGGQDQVPVQRDAAAGPMLLPGPQQQRRRVVHARRSARWRSTAPRPARSRTGSPAVHSPNKMIANGNQAIDGIVCRPVMIEPTAARSGGILATRTPTTEPITRASR